MCLFTKARTVAIILARSAGSEAMYCAGVLTFGGGFMDSPFPERSEGSAIAYLESSICMIKARKDHGLARLRILKSISTTLPGIEQKETEITENFSFFSVPLFPLVQIACRGTFFRQVRSFSALS